MNILKFDMNILILDNCENVEKIRAILEYQKSNKIKLALDADHALKMAKREQIDLFVANVCIDINKCKTMFNKMHKEHPNIITIAIADKPMQSDYNIKKVNLQKLSNIVNVLTTNNSIVTYHAAFYVKDDDSLLTVDLDDWYSDQEIRDKLAKSFSAKTVKDLKTKLENPSLHKLDNGIINVAYTKSKNSKTHSKLTLNQEL
jgi:flagellar basal body-associated protein FliL